MTHEQAKTLKVRIETLQSLMIAYVTGERAAGQPHEYSDLYCDLNIDLEDAAYSQPNPHHTLEVFWSFCKLKCEELGSYAERRAYVHNIYKDILLDLERKIRRQKEPLHWGKANQLMNDELTPVRRQWLKAKNFLGSSLPDYENAIKEATNSIESALKILLSEPKASLGKLAKTANIDSDIRALMSKAYGLVSNKDFVRHGGTQESVILQEDAEFFLEFAAISIVYLKKRLGTADNVVRPYSG